MMKALLRPRLSVVLSIWVLAAAVPAAGQGGAPIFTTGAAEIEINGRVQTQFNTTTVEDAETGEWLMRRVRLSASVKLNDLVSGEIAPDFAGNRVSLKDAYVRLTFDPALSVLAGNAHRPFSRIEQTSSTRMLPVERGLRIRGVAGFDHYELVNGLDYSDRDIGLQVMGAPEGAPLGFSYAAGVFAGPLQGEAAGEDPTQFAARIGMRPLERLRVGAAWSSREFADPLGGSAGLRRGHAFEADVEYGAFAPGLHLIAEVAGGDFDPFSDRRFFGAQGWLAYRTGPLGTAISGIEPLLRVSYGDLDEPLGAAAGGTLLTPGVNVHLGGLNRLMLNYDLWSPRDGDSEGSFKAMFQMAF